MRNYNILKIIKILIENAILTMKSRVFYLYRGHMSASYGGSTGPCGLYTTSLRIAISLL